MSTLGKIFLFGGLAVSYIIAFVFAVLLLAPSNPITYTKGTEPFKVSNATDGGSTIQAGQILVYEVHYCRNTDAPASVQRTLVGKVTVSLNRTTSQAEKGCAISKVANTIIPTYIPAGTYHMDLAITYHVNPLKDVIVRAKTQDFTVTAPAKDANGQVIPLPVIIPELNNQPGTINGGALPDDEVLNQVAPERTNQTAPVQQQNVQSNTPAPVEPTEPTPSSLDRTVCRISLGLLLCK